MNKEKLTCVQNIDSISGNLYDLSIELWKHPETAFKEHYATKLLINELKVAGFEIEENIAGIPTAFIGKWGVGRPYIGYLAEFDALPAQSQQVITYRQPIKKDAPGHGCGHNLMAAAHLGAVIAIKNEMEANGLPGTVFFYGCPAEEVLTGKVFMARAGVFNDLDCALNFHPGAINGVSLRRLSGLNNVKFNFWGKSSHASTAPADGRSGSDAAELMNVGANYLREHIHSDVRINYVTTNGGQVPNIVPDFGQTWYFIRALKREMVNEVYERLINVAKGAALMTGVNLEIDFQGGCYPTMQNKVLAEVVWRALTEIGPENFTDEELSFASELNKTCTSAGLPAYGVELKTPIHDNVLPLWGEGTFAYNSTDIGDVSHIVPTVMFNTACFNTKANLHSWQVTACAGHSIGLKGMLYAAKVLSAAGIYLVQEPSIIAKARHELNTELAGVSYECPIPDGVLPPIS